MSNDKLKELTDNMAAAQTEVLDNLEVLKGKEYTQLVALHGGAIAVLQASGSAFISHPQIDAIESAINFSIKCVVQVGAAQVMRLRGVELSSVSAFQVSEEFMRDLQAFVQQAVRRVSVGEGNINQVGDGE